MNSFENVVPSDDKIKKMELLRWGKHQQQHGKTKEEALALCYKIEGK